MAQWGDRDQYSDAPKFVVTPDGQTGQDRFGNTTIGVFGIDDNEAIAARGDGKGAVGPGWVLRTDRGGGRVTIETLVAMTGAFSTGDAVSFTNTSTGLVAGAGGTADDSLFPDS